MGSRNRVLSWGLFCTTLATLLLELLDARLLSVLTWYHLSFFAISVAMLGMAGGAIAVFALGSRVAGENAKRALARTTFALSLSIPLTCLYLLKMSIPDVTTLGIREILPLAASTVVLTIPFFLSGAAVTLALTRCGGRIGHLYGADLLGASAGCLLIVPLLQVADIMTVALITAAVAAAAAGLFTRFASTGSGRLGGGFALGLAALAVLHLLLGSPIAISSSKGQQIAPQAVDRSVWNAYSHVILTKPRRERPFYWGRGQTFEKSVANVAMMYIDGVAGTAMTEWDGRRESIAWVRHDITSLPYYLRPGGDVAIIGVGGGRDILSAVWGKSRSITAVELNQSIIDILTGSHRDFAKITEIDGLKLVTDEARSYFSRSQQKFDVLQMSLVDTWASTGAGAFTLSENALYTTEAWRLFLDRLRPGGVLSTSRWYSPANVSETSRLLALAVSTLIDIGVEDPARHIALVSRFKIATLLVSPTPFGESDLLKLREVANSYRYALLALPGEVSADGRLAEILRSRSQADLAQAVSDPIYDYRPPTDDRPYFFNMLKPAGVLQIGRVPWGEIIEGSGGVLWGNIQATATLAVLLGVTCVLAALILFVPLFWCGVPKMRASTFTLSLLYFALIGYAFMAVQIPFLQRFSVFLGHPIYTFSVILFAMILFAGLGSFASERLVLQGNRWHVAIPCGIAVVLLALTATMQAVLDAALPLSLPVRIAVVIGLVAPVSTLLGFCFPIGMRLVANISGAAAPWMWGANGACGVIASILGVVVSMWLGIQANLLLAASLYLALAVIAVPLARASFSTAD